MHHWLQEAAKSNNRVRPLFIGMPDTTTFQCDIDLVSAKAGESWQQSSLELPRQGLPDQVMGI